jgi:hypothetical protein
MQNRSDSGCSSAKKRIDNQVIFLCQSQDQSFRELHRELAGVRRFLDVVIFDIREDPDISRVFPQWMARKGSFPWTFIGLLAGVFLGYAYIVQIKRKEVALCVPENRLVSPGKTEFAI